MAATKRDDWHKDLAFGIAGVIAGILLSTLQVITNQMVTPVAALEALGIAVFFFVLCHKVDFPANRLGQLASGVFVGYVLAIALTAS